MRTITVVSAVLLASSGTAAAEVRGLIVDKTTGEPVIGATVVADTGASAITDELGVYVLAAPPTAAVTVYYADVMVASPWTARIPIDTSTAYDSYGCYFPLAPTAMERAWPSLGVTAKRDDFTVGRSGTVADLLAMVPALHGVPSEERLGGGLRLPGSPSLSRVFTDEVGLHARSTESALVAGGGLIAVESLAGLNQRETTLGASFLHDGEPGGSLAALLRGPIARDKAWYALGADLRPGTGQLYGRIDAASTPDHQGRVIALGTATGWPAATPSASTIAIPRLIGGEDGRVGDLWLDARWRSKLDDARLEIEAGATTQTLVVAGERISRHAGRIGAVRRFRARGTHELHAMADATATDLRIDAFDTWNLRPSVAVRAGVRVEHGDATAYRPEASLTWDPTGEGSSRYFVDVARHDLTTGGQHQIGDKLVLGGAWRRTETDGAATDAVHGWALYHPWDPGLVVRAAVSSPLVEDAPVTSHVEASYRMTVCIGDLIAAAGAAHADDRTSGTFAFAWQAGRFARGLEVVIAGYTGDDPAFQLTAARSW